MLKIASRKLKKKTNRTKPSRTSRQWKSSSRYLERPVLHHKTKLARHLSIREPFQHLPAEIIHPVQAKRAVPAWKHQPQEGLPGNASKYPRGTLEERGLGRTFSPAATLTQTLDQRHKVDGWALAAGAKVASSAKQRSLRWETDPTCSKFQAVKFCCVQNKSRGN